MTTSGLIDANVFVHAHTSDAHSAECAAFLGALERGDAHAELHPLVLHELLYVLPRYIKQMTRANLAEYALSILAWPGLDGDNATMGEAVERWRDAPRLSFVDAYLSTLALRQGVSVYTKDMIDFRAQGVSVPDPLPA